MKPVFYVFDGLDPDEIRLYETEASARLEAEALALRGRVAIVTRLVARYEPAATVHEVE